HDQLLAVVRETPTLARVLDRALDLERIEIVDDDNAVLPSELIQEAAQDRDAFAEITRAESALFLGPAAREIDTPDRRSAVLAGAFVELPCVDRQPLRECRRIVRIGRHDFEARDGGRAFGVALCPRRDADGGDRN